MLESSKWHKTGRIRTSLRALPDLAAVVWRVGEVAGRERVAARRRCKDAMNVVLFCCKGSRQPVGILGAGYLLGGCWEKRGGIRETVVVVLGYLLITVAGKKRKMGQTRSLQGRTQHYSRAGDMNHTLYLSLPTLPTTVLHRRVDGLPHYSTATEAQTAQVRHCTAVSGSFRSQAPSRSHRLLLCAKPSLSMKT